MRLIIKIAKNSPMIVNGENGTYLKSRNLIFKTCNPLSAKVGNDMVVTHIRAAPAKSCRLALLAV